MSTSASPERDDPFLHTDPPPLIARGLAYVLIALFSVSVLAAAVVRVPETVSGPFTLVPVRGTDPVRAVRQGVVSDVRVAEGEEVRKGAVLFTLQSAPVGDRAAALREAEAQVRGAREGLANAESLFAAQGRADVVERRRLEARVVRLGRAIELKTRQLALTRQLADQYRGGAARGAVGGVEASRLELEAQRLDEELETASGERDDASAQIARLRSAALAREAEYRETRRRLGEAVETGGIRTASLRKDLELTSASGAAAGSGFELAVSAPCAGTVLRLRVNAPGAVVREGEVLSELACAGEKLQAELLVPQAGVPLVAAGQGVKLRYDAFPYQRFGVRFGTVRWVGPGGSGDAAEGGAPNAAAGAFRAIVDVPEGAIRVRGALRALLPGMGGRADIVVGRRSLASFAFEPIRQLRETFAEVPDSATRRR